MKFRAIAFLTCVIALLYEACTNSDDYLYDESESTFIEVSAEMAYSFDSLSERSKADTIRPGDSLIFIANIQPSKSIKIKRYLWTLDGNPFSFDFSFRSAINKPGLHKIAFILETFFGDTLSDTLTLQVSSPPVLLDTAFIPATGSQGIPTTGGVSFAWNGYDPDSIAFLYYRFSIDGLIDTILNVPYFTYWQNLEPLSHYRWHVQAINEFGFTSSNTIEGNFFTAGGPNECGITGFIELSAKDNAITAFAYSAKISILDSTDREIFSDIIKGNSQNAQPFVVSPLNEGSYRIAINVPKYPDYFKDTFDLVLSANEVQELDTIALTDSIPPRIAAIENGISDDSTNTLEYADTLRFLVTDLGTPQSQKTVLAYLESTQLVEKVGAGDTFTVALPTSAKTWTTRQLDIVAIDASKNKSTRSYTIKPAESWIKTNTSYTIYADTLTNNLTTFFIIDNNPFGFVLDTCKFIINNQKQSSKQASSFLCKITTSLQDLQSGVNTIQSIAVYTNGISHKKEWYITYINEE